MGFKIAIDGPAGSGKGYVASTVAKKLKLLYIDTGAMYRAFGLYALKNNVDLQNEEEVNEALTLAVISFLYVGDILKVYLNNEDVSDEIRTEQVGMLASKVSAIPSVRYYMVDRQRELAGKYNVIMEGRDIGSIVFPNADLKIFLTASPEERAKRRLLDLKLKGKDVTFEEVLEDIQRRDEADIHKSISPLIKTEDMIELDTTNLDKEQVIDNVMRLVKEKGLV